MGERIRNKPSAEGRALGAQMARLCDLAEPATRARFPESKPRCSSCAFRAGTFPNGCATTQMDALKCLLEVKPFMCHMSPKDANGEHLEVCAGWAALIERDDRPRLAPWPFSDEAQSATPEPR